MRLAVHSTLTRPKYESGHTPIVYHLIDLLPLARSVTERLGLVSAHADIDLAFCPLADKDTGHRVRRRALEGRLVW